VARASTLKNDDENIAVCSFTLREGLTLKRLARAIGTDVDTILAMNNLSSSKRRTKDSSSTSRFAPASSARCSPTPTTRSTTAVRRGDTLYSIAKRHHLSVEDLLDSTISVAATSCTPARSFACRHRGRSRRAACEGRLLGYLVAELLGC